MAKIEFVSYDGKFPNRCSGTLVLRIDGVERNLGKYCMQTGGRASFDKNGDEHVESGPWTVDVPDDLLSIKEEIEECVNANVRPGCCGGCL